MSHRSRYKSPPATDYRNNAASDHARTNRREPVELSALLDKRRMEEESTKRPVFMTKAQREAAALQRRAEQVKQRQVQIELSSESVRQQEPLKTQHLGEYRSEEFSQMKRRYLGIGEKPKYEQSKRIKSTTATSVPKSTLPKIDWEEWEDTSQASHSNPLYDSNNIQQSIMFGRGHLGGMGDDLLDAKQTASDRKGGHWSEKKLQDMTERDWRIMRSELEISTKGTAIPKPIRFWKEAGLPEPVLRAINKIGYKDPTPIQRQAIPVTMQNRDIIGVAETGSGKTAAFLIPILVFIARMPKISSLNAHDGPYALILAPTRELAQQIEQEATKFSRYLGYTVVSIVGGHEIGKQSFALRNGAEIIIATPGRLKDCLDRKYLALNQCTYVVMDEADRMIDMGFEADVNYILDQLPVSQAKPNDESAENVARMVRDGLPLYRQTTMFSATMPEAVEKIAQQYLRRPVKILVGTKGKAVETVEQIIEMVSEDRKRSKLLSLLSQGWAAPMIVFVNLKRNVDGVAKVLEQEGYRVTSLHGGKSQDNRENALNQLRNGTKDILVATDVAGRGIDIPNVSLVVNYDMTTTIENYTHRIGRTGRAGKKGVAVTFLTPEDNDVYYDLKQMLQQGGCNIPAELARHEASRTKKGEAKKVYI